MDARRKLTQLDYQRIAFEVSQGLTIRQVASDWSISTKYVTRILDRVHGTVSASEVETYSCSGCGYGFSSNMALSAHQAVWTSGGTHELSCQAVMPIGNR